MWINDGIDSGDLLATDVVNFNGEESLTEVHYKVMQSAHKLYLDAVELIKNNSALRVKQNSIQAREVFNWQTEDQKLIQFYKKLSE